MPVFADKNAAQTLIKQLKESLEYYNVSLVAYILMPSHLHMLLGFKNVEILSKFMQSFKILSSKRIGRILPEALSGKLIKNGSFHLWKTRFDDLVITSEKQFRIKLEYIHNNPVKAGIAGDVCDWPYSSAAAWIQNKPGDLHIDMNFGWT